MIGRVYEESVYVTFFKNAKGGRVCIYPMDPNMLDIRDNRLKFFSNEVDNAIVIECDSKGKWWTLNVGNQRY